MDMMGGLVTVFDDATGHHSGNNDSQEMVYVGHGRRRGLIRNTPDSAKTPAV